jgi:hypothetical protein
VRRASSERRIGLVSTRRRSLIAITLVALAVAATRPALAALDPQSHRIRLELTPRVCILAASDVQCETTVAANWKSRDDESLCLVVVGRPEIRRCWEHFSEGEYTVSLTFASDLTFRLTDPASSQIYAEEALRVIREALRYRPKRRQPWNIFG